MKRYPFFLATVASLALAVTAAADESPVVEQIDDILVKRDGGDLKAHTLTGDDRTPPKYFILYFSASW